MSLYNKDQAWVTLVTNDSYAIGALVLVKSLENALTTRPFVVMYTDGVSDPMLNLLKEYFVDTIYVNVFDSGDTANLALLGRPDLGITFTKLHCWRLTQYGKCVFLDADTLVLKHVDELFERDEFSAAPDVGWPDCFNSGVFVFKPSETTYAALMKFASTVGSFDGGDQGLLNQFFGSWGTDDILKHLPFIYNMTASASYSYLPAFFRFYHDIKIIHFIGGTKPWMQIVDPETQKVYPPDGEYHLTEFLQYWWDIFCMHVHARLIPAMATQVHMFPQVKSLQSRKENIPPHYPRSYQHQSTQQSAQYDNSHQPTQYSIPPSQPTPSVTHQVHVPFSNQSTNQTSHQSPPTSESFHPSQPTNESFHPSQPSNESFHIPEYNKQPFHQSEHTNHSFEPTNQSVDSSGHSQDFGQQSVDVSTQSDHVSGVPTTPVVHKLKESIILPKTPAQIAYENMQQRRNWELGKVDYLGDAAFDNILNKINQTGSVVKIDIPETAETAYHADSKRRIAWEQGKIDYSGRDAFDNILDKIQDTGAALILDSPFEGERRVLHRPTKKQNIPKTDTSATFPIPKPPKTSSTVNTPFAVSREKKKHRLRKKPSTSSKENVPSPPIPANASTSILPEDTITYPRLLHPISSSYVLSNSDVTGGHMIQLERGSYRENVSRTKKKKNGMAGVLAGMRCGERRFLWEQGHMDYGGLDSFDNIMSKINESLAGKPNPPCFPPPCPLDKPCFPDCPCARRKGAIKDARLKEAKMLDTLPRPPEF